MLDDRVGHARQVEGVLAALGGVGLELAYESCLRRPDLLAPATADHLTDASRTRLVTGRPDIVVAAGRRTLPVLRWLKRRADVPLFTVYLMRPGRLRDLDLVAIPAHDRPWPDARVVTTLGACHPFHRELLDAASDTLPDAARGLPRPHVAVLIGGPTRRLRFGTREALALAERIDGLVAALGGSALITTSRRTPAWVAASLTGRLTVPHLVHRIEDPGPNPLRAFLGVADRVVVTSDSASMLSEACATGRPVHVFRLPRTPAKLDRLESLLRQRGFVQPWAVATSPPPRPLDEARRIARVIRARFAGSTLSEEAA